MFSAIIMASGFSSRMKDKNKLLLKIDNKTIIEHVINSVLEHDFDKIVLITSYDEIIDLGKKHKIDVIKNNSPELGQSNSLKLGVLNCHESSNYMFFVADQPFLTYESINKIVMFHKKNNTKIIIPILNNIRKSPTIFPNSLRSQLLSLTGDIGGRAVIKENENLVYTIEVNDEKSFFDIDTPKDYELAMSLKKTNHHL